MKRFIKALAFGLAISLAFFIITSASRADEATYTNEHGDRAILLSESVEASITADPTYNGRAYLQQTWTEDHYMTDVRTVFRRGETFQFFHTLHVTGGGRIIKKVIIKVAGPQAKVIVIEGPWYLTDGTWWFRITLSLPADGNYKLMVKAVGSRPVGNKAGVTIVPW